MLESFTLDGIVKTQLITIRNEYKEIAAINFYTQEDLRIILNKVEQFLFKINGYCKRLQDFKDYIQYLKVLLKDVNERRKQMNITPDDSVFPIIQLFMLKMSKRIQDSYEMGLPKFGDYEFCASYFNFCKNNLKIIDDHCIETMIKLYSGNPPIFSLAAGWYVSERNDVEKALRILSMGLQFHKTNQYLYTKALKLQLAQSIKQKNRRENVRIEEIEKLAKNILSWVLSGEFLIEILELLEPYDFTKHIEAWIVYELETKHPKSAKVWHTLAQRICRGSEEEPDSDNFNQAVLKYQEGLRKVSENEKSILLTKYFDWLLYRRNPTAIKAHFISVCDQVAAGDNLPEARFYIMWAGMVRGEGSSSEAEREAFRILDQGIKSFPDCVDLWKLYIKYAVDADDENLVEKVLETALNRTKGANQAIWETYILYKRLIDNNEGIERAYKRVLGHPEVERVFRASYVDWLYLAKGIKATRSAYNELKLREPYTKDLHSVILTIELLQFNPDFDLLKPIYETACQQFNDYESWVDYIEFVCTSDAMTPQEKAEQVPRILQNALKNVPNLTNTHFDGRFENLRRSYPQLFIEE